MIATREEKLIATFKEVAPISSPVKDEVIFPTTSAKQQGKFLFKINSFKLSSATEAESIANSATEIPISTKTSISTNTPNVLSTNMTETSSFKAIVLPPPPEPPIMEEKNTDILPEVSSQLSIEKIEENFNGISQIPLLNEKVFQSDATLGNYIDSVYKVIF